MERNPPASRRSRYALIGLMVSAGFRCMEPRDFLSATKTVPILWFPESLLDKLGRVPQFSGFA